MTLVNMVVKNMKQRALATALTTFSVSLGVALASAILIVKRGVQSRFERAHAGYELIVGAKGSPLQLTLNTVYHLDVSPGNVPWSLFKELREHKIVKLAVPFAVGDNYQGHRLVGTTDEFLTKFEFLDGQRFVFAQGRPFKFSEDALEHAFEEAAQRARALREGRQPPEEHDHGEQVFEAVLGAEAARATGLKLGDRFQAAHGVREDGHEHAERWEVVGILAPSGTANDRAIFINLDSFYHIKGHETGGEPLFAEQREDAPPGQISAIALKLRAPALQFQLKRQIDERPYAMAVIPAWEVRRLFDIIGNIDRVLLAQAILIVIVAAIAIAASIYNSINERRREIAILRALGARRLTVFAIIVLEAALICALGGALGLAGGHIVVGAASGALQAASGFRVSAMEFHIIELWLWLGCVILGVVSGLGPAARAYRTDVAQNLSPTT
jgi:putative ABC transport system permease protein